MTARPTFAPTDDATGSLLDLINADWRPFCEDDRNTIARAIRDDAEANGGSINANRVRDRLAALPVLDQPKPQRVGPVYRALCLAGVISVDGWDTTLHTETGRNGGKPARTYRWVGEPS